MTCSSALGVRAVDPAQEGEEVGPGVAGAGLLASPCRSRPRARRTGWSSRCARSRGCGARPPRAQRQHRLGPVERLDLGLLVDREDDRPLGRREIQPDDVPDLGLERRVGAELERLDPVRLEARLGPDPLDGRDRGADPGRHPPSAPVGRPVGRRLERQGDDPIAGRSVVGRFAARSRRVPQAEAEAELATLRALGVPLAQGYLLGRPAAVDEWADRRQS